MPKKVAQPTALSDLLTEQTASTMASLKENPSIDTPLRLRGGGVPQRHSRKKTIINRQNARTIFFDDNAWTQLDNVNYNNRMNPQRVVQTALHDFFERYYDAKKQGLTSEGLQRIALYQQTIEL